MAGTQTTDVRLLSVVWFDVLPPKYGGQKAVALFNAYLAEHAPLLCLCAKSNQGAQSTYRVESRLPLGKWQFFNPLVWRRIYLTAKRERTTHLLLEFPYHGIAVVLCKRLLKVKLALHSHNVEYLRFKESSNKGWRWLYTLERWTMKNADAVFFTTEEDRQTAKKNFGLDEEKLIVAPYGVEEKTGLIKEEAQAAIRKRHSIARDERILLFAGTLDYGPNADAVASLVEKIIPLLNQTSLVYKLIVCGRNRFRAFRFLNDLQNERLVMAGEVKDVEMYFAAADVFVNAVVNGGGVQTKTMDALSFNLNTVCFESKAAGFKHTGSKLFTVADDDWDGFAKAVMEASKKSLPTPALFFQTYDWRRISNSVFQKLLTC